MATAAEKLSAISASSTEGKTQAIRILIIQHLEHAGLSEDVIGPVKDALEKSETKGEGSTLYELLSSAGEAASAPPAPPPAAAGRKPSMQQAQQMQQAPPPQAQQTRMSMQAQQPPATRMSAQMSGSVAYNAQQAAMIQNQLAEQKPVIAKEPKVRDPKLDEQLMAAAKSGAVDTIPSLINSGAYVNYQDGAGTSPLLAATEADKIEVVKVLLQNGADVNLARPDGTSPLLCAYKSNKKKLLKELTAGAFRTLNSAVHQTGHIGGGMMYDGMSEEEGVTAMDMCQLRDEAEKLFKLQAHPEVPPPSPMFVRKESMVDMGAPGDISNLRQGGVRLLMQELCNATQKVTP
eukprot:gnl/MRDRNA2_/MRDRNA2_89459_c0_seq1.p1 gnl/MRDRNA2_/MRDRNA2_89459_c0~~gnl/MRDRNA2_/MRDRNA2_89459_c0_seq1.p1  ORF type:complete len:375 (+),score=104.32 gnl/MRDRNA2_/MRDRNA2_89459_c0_seq1:84-1127(+)